MPEPQVATKAPESDAAEQKHIPSPSVSSANKPSMSSSSAMGEHCTSDRPTPSGRSGTGEVVDVNGVKCYISKPSDYPQAPTRLLLLLTPGTGIQSTNNQIQADLFASEGFLVVMPDLFDGDAAPNTKVTQDEQAPMIDKLKAGLAGAAKSFVIDMWLARHTDEKVHPILEKVVEGCETRFKDAVKHGVYGVGYCFGAKYILHLAADRSLRATSTQHDVEHDAEQTMRKGPFIKAGALAHATCVTAEDFEGIKVPLSLVCVEDDALFPDNVRTAGEDYLSKHNIEHEVKVYPGVPHGFAICGEYDQSVVKEAQAAAHDQLISWLKSH